MSKHMNFMIAALLASTSLAGAASAQTSAPAPGATAEKPQAEANILQEVIVTAVRKRTENVQTTPIAITAIGTRTLERAHVTDLSGIGSLAPNLQIVRTITSADAAAIYLRGFGAQANQPAVDPHIAMFVDGIYQPALSGELVDMFDIAQVEVAAGPQGTLAGKNASVGAVYITSDKPTGDFSGLIEGDYGSYDQFGARAKVNVPIIRDDAGNAILAGKISLVEKEGGNWIYNATNGKTDMGGVNEKAARIALAFKPSDAFDWDLVGFLLAQRNPQQGLQPAGFYGAVSGNQSRVFQPPSTALCRLYPCVPTPYGVTDTNYTTIGPADTVEISSTMSYRLSPVTLTSVTGYINYWYDANTDVSGTPVNILDQYNGRQRYDQESEEFRISSNKGGGWDFDSHLDWVVGGYYSNHNYSAAQNLGIFAAPGVANNRSFQNGNDQSTAVFAHLIYNFTDQWTGTFGVRQSWDQKNHNYQPGNNPNFYYDTPIGFHNTSFEAGTAYQFDPDRMVYFRFAQGYEAGGYNGFPSTPNSGTSFQSETNNAYEVGVKTDWLHKRLRVNADLFVNEISQLQVPGLHSIPIAPFLLVTTTNAASATVEGLESQIIAVPIDNLTTHLTLGYLHTRYDKYTGTVCSNVNGVAADCSGVPFGYAPKWTIDLGGDYSMDLPNDYGTATFSADWNYKSSLYVSDPAYPASFQEGYGLINAGLKWTDPSDRYTVEFYGTNILNRRYKAEVSDSAGLAIEEDDGRPAEWGLRLTAKFGS